MAHTRAIGKGAELAGWLCLNHDYSTGLGRKKNHGGKRPGIQTGTNGQGGKVLLQSVWLDGNAVFWVGPVELRAELYL